MRKQTPALIAVAAIAAVTAACGLKGGAPKARTPGVLGGLTVEGRDGAVRVGFSANAGVSETRVEAFDILRRADQSGTRTFFERVGTILPVAGGAHGYHWIDSTMRSGTTYRYRVRVRLAGDPPATALRYAGPEETIAWDDPPPPPSNVRATALHLAARLTWSEVEGASGYRVYSVDSAGAASAEPASRGLITHPWWNAVALEDGKRERFAVRTVRIAHPQTATPPAIGETPHDSAPAGVEVADAAAAGIAIPRNDIGGALRKQAASLVGEGALPGIESKSSEIVSVTPGLTAEPPAPRLLHLAVTDSGMSLSWRPSTAEEVAGYFVERREMITDSRPKDLIPIRRTPEPVPGSGWIDREVKAGALYEYRVRTVDASGTYGPPTDTVTKKYDPAPRRP